VFLKRNKKKFVEIIAGKISEKLAIVAKIIA